jgi:hypothetical protein
MGKYENMLAHLKRMVEDTDTNGTALVAIHPKFQDWIRAKTEAEL